MLYTRRMQASPAHRPALGSDCSCDSDARFSSASSCSVSSAVQSNSAMTSASADSFDGAFQFCRIFFRQAPSTATARDWRVDFPRADQNLSIRLAELDPARLSLPSIWPNEPNHLVHPLIPASRKLCSHSARS